MNSNTDILDSEVNKDKNTEPQDDFSAEKMYVTSKTVNV